MRNTGGAAPSSQRVARTASQPAETTGSWKKRALKRLLALGLGILMSALLAEMLVLLIFGEQVKFPRHVVGASWGLRYNEPNAHYRHKSADGVWYFDINGEGMRADRDYARTKPPNTFRIVSLGDSFTIGYEVAEKECFSRVLERELRSQGLPVEVLNAGVSGYSNAEELLYLERELLSYDPDIVLVSFYFNDLIDNVRSGLFALEGDRLVAENERYVPGGALANYLNRSAVFGLLAGYSNAFALAKERATRLMRRSILEDNEKTLLGVAHAEDSSPNGISETLIQQQKLAAAILDRMYAVLSERNIPLVIQSIPGVTLVDVFPVQFFDTTRPGITYLPMKPLLASLERRAPAYNLRSHMHWTAAAHEVSGKAIAAAILRENLLARRPAAPDPGLAAAAGKVEEGASRRGRERQSAPSG